MYKTTLALFDEVLAESNWPQDDHALPSEMITDTEAATDEDNFRAGEPRGGEERREAPGDEDPLSLPAHKRAHVYRRPTLRALRAKLSTTPHTD